MISIIICSREHDMPEKLRLNIGETIGSGIEYETIVIDNSQNQYSIFEAYNKGVSLSRYPFLLFMHDDINYRTNEWGAKLIEHFSNPGVGCVGIGGSPYLPYAPGGWWCSGIGYLHLLQRIENSEEPVFLNWFPENAIKQDVVVLDGVWFCMRRKLFEVIRFDEKTFHGFHFYDLDISLQAYLAGYQVLCVKDILIYHLSPGNFNEKWIENALLFRKKWKHRLPVSVQPHSLKEQWRMEHYALKMWIAHCLQKGYQKRAQIYWGALQILWGFKRGYLYYKTPVLASVVFARYLKNLFLRR